MFTGNSLNFTGKFRPIVCIFPAPLYASNEAILRPLKVMNELFAHFVFFIYYDFFKDKTNLFLFLLSLMRVIIILKQILQLFMISSCFKNK
jgi:hypothetical protein